MPKNSSSNFDYAAFSRALASWFQMARRDLPWRHEANARDAYRVLVSEVMLQQTTVKAVIPFYTRFLARFPDVQTLASASIEDVLPLWAGLGYYSRARMLHRCAQVVTEKYGGAFPDDLNRVLDLPGIGRYTAGAVTSIAFDQKSPIVDANVARIFSRIFLIDGDLKSGANQKTLWQNAENVVARCDENRPSVVNPAMMELGALVCTPRAPRCEACPVQKLCGAFTTNRQNELPFVKAKRAFVELRDVCVFAVRESSLDGESSTRNAQFLLRQRAHDAESPSQKTWWRGMWELPRATCRADENAAIENTASGNATSGNMAFESGNVESEMQALTRILRDELQISPAQFSIDTKLRTVKHGVTHHKISLECWRVVVADDIEIRGAQWFGAEEIAHLALPSAMKTLIAWLQSHHENEQKTLF